MVVVWFLLKECYSAAEESDSLGKDNFGVPETFWGTFFLATVRGKHVAVERPVF